MVGVVSLSRTRVCLSFYVLSLLIVKKFRAWPITVVAPVELDEIDHSSSDHLSPPKAHRTTARLIRKTSADCFDILFDASNLLTEGPRLFCCATTCNLADSAPIEACRTKNQ